MKSISGVLGGLLLLVMTAYRGGAQSKCFTTHAGAMIIQGEAMGRGMISDDVGYGINFTLGTQLTKNLHFTVEAGHHSFSIDYMMPAREASYYYGASHHSSAGIGLMLFPFQKGRYASLYQSYSPYIHGTAGIVLQRNSIEDAINMPFTLHPGTFILPYGEASFWLKNAPNPPLVPRYLWWRQNYLYR